MKEIINPSKEYIRSLHEKSKDLTTEQLMSEIQSLTDKRISEIRNTKTDVEVKGTAYYVANEGSDDNDGKSPETARQTPERVTLARRNEELV